MWKGTTPINNFFTPLFPFLLYSSSFSVPCQQILGSSHKSNYLQESFCSMFFSFVLELIFLRNVILSVPNFTGCIAPPAPAFLPRALPWHFGGLLEELCSCTREDAQPHATPRSFGVTETWKRSTASLWAKLKTPTWSAGLGRFLCLKGRRCISRRRFPSPLIWFWPRLYLRKGEREPRSSEKLLR